ncbi:MAG: hypothetical protein KC543_00705 [Myxococcales bacterium]|nr:hypothetical protein [Myxococcales bacterium]
MDVPVRAPESDPPNTPLSALAAGATRQVDGLLDRVRGHYWTLAPYLAHRVRPVVPPPSVPFSTIVHDPTYGPLEITGHLHERAGADTCAILVHGLGGDAKSYYMIEAAEAALGVGISALRLNLRGADHKTPDYYHAGLTDDLRAACTSAQLAKYRALVLLGYSIGGHVVLRFLTEGAKPRVTSGAAVCPPLAIEASAREIDRPRSLPYRKYLLAGLLEMYRYIAAQRPVPVSVRDAAKIKTIHDWDDQIVAPRFHFDGAEHYWHSASVAPRLGLLCRPTLVVVSRHDPMVAWSSVHPYLERRDAVETVLLDRGGHVGFPPKVQLGVNDSPVRGSVHRQVLEWLVSRRPRA